MNLVHLTQFVFNSQMGSKCVTMHVTNIFVERMLNVQQLVIGLNVSVDKVSLETPFIDAVYQMSVKKMKIAPMIKFVEPTLMESTNVYSPVCTLHALVMQRVLVLIIRLSVPVLKVTPAILSTVQLVVIHFKQTSVNIVQNVAKIVHVDALNMVSWIVKMPVKTSFVVQTQSASLSIMLENVSVYLNTMAILITF